MNRPRRLSSRPPEPDGASKKGFAGLGLLIESIEIPSSRSREILERALMMNGLAEARIENEIEGSRGTIFTIGIGLRQRLMIIGQDILESRDPASAAAEKLKALGIAKT
ncbi:MAG: hypothetical protein U0R44_01925 [Candidatus Micrarchaeia archaeon]